MEERKYRIRSARPRRRRAVLHTSTHFTPRCSHRQAPPCTAVRAMSEAVVGAVNDVSAATGLPVAAVILIAVVVVFAVLVQICRAPRSASTARAASARR